ncbi:hypothetical protein L1987_51506 [Smallanthus sonchifolius]|uniref:Uncharacterized protein n=1 Tax=Smallanthus sonchifolius TaxID=185202 RepID=A0ACB9ER58_9ASTR|nr:hypothetical protein L1987_51506 [Smallanthus sonchifolius]
MMNLLVISLFLTTLLTAAVSSSPSQSDEVIVKDGHRVVTVEYDKEPDRGVTKVLISPPDKKPKPEKQRMFSGPRDLVCDAYGKCKHKVTNALEKTKDVEKRPGESLSEKVTGHTVKESSAHGMGMVKELAGDVKAAVKDGASKDFDIVDSPKRSVEDVARNATVGVQETVKNVEEMRGISLTDIMSKLKQVIYDVVSTIHVLGFSTAYGMCVWVTFVSSYVLGRYLPRQMFGIVQSRIYPVYFKAMAYCVSAALLGHLGTLKTEVLSTKVGMFQSLCLVSTLLMVLINMILLEPKATKVMYERMKIEKEEGRGVGVAAVAKEGVVDGGGPTVVRSAASVVVRQDVLRLNEKLKRLNAYSSTLNLFTLVALTWHMAYMGQRLQATHS